MKAYHFKKISPWMRGEKGRGSYLFGLGTQKEIIGLVTKFTRKHPYKAPAQELALKFGCSLGVIKYLAKYIRMDLIEKKMIPNNTDFRGGRAFVLTENMKKMALQKCEDSARTSSKILDFKAFFPESTPKPKMDTEIRAAILNIINKFNSNRPASKKVIPKTKSVGGFL